MDVVTAIRSRRTCKEFTGAPLPRARVDALLDLAQWAPTHRLTQPWRWYCLDQPGIAALGRHLAATPAITAVPDPAKGAAKLAKLAERLPSLGALIIATYVRSSDAIIDAEDLAAAAAAIQTLLLAATADGLGSFWSTNPALTHALTLRYCGGDPEREGILGAIWLGDVRVAPAPPPRVGIAARRLWVAP